MAELNKAIDEACDRNCSLDGFKVCDLKKYLSAHGQNVSGRKSELIERVRGVRKLGLIDLSSVAQEDSKRFEQRKCDKLTTPLNEKLPHPNILKTWTTNFQNIPDFSEKEIYNYIVLKMNSKKQLKSKVFYEDRHVHSVEINELNDDYSHFYIRCKVLPSLPSEKKKDSPDYNVWIMMSRVTGNVNSAECNCTAGEGEACNHISALTYAIADISQKKKDGKLAPTSEKCKWNNPRKRKLSPQKAQDIKFRKQMWGRESSSVENEKCVTVTKPRLNLKTDVQRFRDKLKQAGSKAGWLKNFHEETDSNKVTEPTLPLLHNILFQYRDTVDICDKSTSESFDNYYNSLKISAADCATIECLTRDQSDSLQWKTAREERITASNFGSVARRKVTTPPDSLLKDVMGYRTFDTKYVKWGRNHEAAARRTYINIMKKTHPGINVKMSGLMVNCAYPHLGASPDGLVHCGHCSDSSGLLEIKCPASENWKFLTPEQCAEDPKFFCALNEQREVILKKKHPYFCQVQGQMAISNRSWCDFVVWTCSGKISVQRIKFEEKFWNDLVKKLNEFYLKAVIPELFCRRILRGKNLHGNCDCFQQTSE